VSNVGRRREDDVLKPQELRIARARASYAREL
jgi:hypothetical protein